MIQTQKAIDHPGRTGSCYPGWLSIQRRHLHGPRRRKHLILHICAQLTRQSDNNDFCTSCGGSGYLVCCDGCDRAFHFTCADPPLNEASQQLDEAWFCHICTSKRTAPQRYPRGLFSALLSNLDKRNTTIFQLPASVRDHFDGVGTAKDGSFTDAVTTRTR